MPGRIRQTVRYVHTSDGLRLAWGESGSGPPLVRAATWLTHLEYDLDSPVWVHWLSFFSEHFRFIRYDERGCGMSDWDVSDMSLERRVKDLETIVEAAGPEGTLHPARHVAGRVGLCHLCDPAPGAGRAHRVVRRVTRAAPCGAAMPKRAGCTKRSPTWADCGAVITPAFRQVFTSRFIPEGTDEQLRWFNELCQKTVAPEIAPVLMRARGETDVTALLAQVQAPTLVLHARNDAISPLSEGRFLASEIRARNSSSSTHAITCCWRTRRPGIVFAKPSSRSPANGILPRRRRSRPCRKRERETLILLAEGLSNSEIAERLGISEKDRAQPPVSSVRQAWCLVSRASHCLRARSRFHQVTSW
jgi:pimeloyl-ACP methyl ester carboxylesterase